MLKITNRLVKNEAEHRGWKVEILSDSGGVLRYSLPGGESVILKSLLSPFTSAVAVEIANDKYALHKLALPLDVPMPETHIITTVNEAAELLEKYKKIVIKPLDSAHGNGITSGITSTNQLSDAIELALEFSETVLLQRHVTGNDIRLLYIDNHLAAASIRRPASVIGNGINTIGTLIEEENKSVHRDKNYQKKLNYIDIQAATRYLGDSINRVPEKGETCIVVGTANIGTGGTAEDITDSVQPDVVEAGQKVLQAVGIPTSAVDFIWDENEFYLIEINANPSLGLHEKPSIGSAQPVAKLYLDWITKELHAVPPGR